MHSDDEADENDVDPINEEEEEKPEEKKEEFLGKYAPRKSASAIMF